VLEEEEEKRSQRRLIGKGLFSDEKQDDCKKSEERVIFEEFKSKSIQVFYC
jgi:hypothetical protein